MDEAGRARLSSTRRQFLAATGAALAASCAARTRSSPINPAAAASQIDRVEASIGGRIGLFAFQAGSQAGLAHRADERFAMCSTFKWLLAAAVLARVDQGTLKLNHPVPIVPADLLEYAPITRRRLGEGALPAGDLAEASVTVSDNTAANLLLRLIGGPPSVTGLCRALGDPVTRLDRTEPALNTNLPGDPRDTTTPRAMAGTLAQVLLGPALTPASRERLLGWLGACTTGRRRLRATLPAGWNAGDKTGTGPGGAAGDVAIAFPPGRPPLLIASYTSGSALGADRLDAAFAELGRIVTDAFA